jgi:hypothetical protein
VRSNIEWPYVSRNLRRARTSGGGTSAIADLLHWRFAACGGATGIWHDVMHCP